MKSKKTIKKLEFTKETIAKLDGGMMNGVRGGNVIETESDIKTKPGQTCTCFTNSSEVYCE